MRTYIIIAITVVIIIGIFKNRDNNLYIVDANKLNVRSLPDLKSNIILQLNKDQKIEVEYYNVEWYTVFFNGVKGYASSEYIIEPTNFFIVFISIFLFMLIPVFISFYFGKSRKKDARYSSGYRLVENTTTLRKAFYDTLIFCYFIALLFSLFS
jgi:hypothetical protein